MNLKEIFQKIVSILSSEADPQRDRKKDLFIFGILDIFLGIFCFSLAMVLLVTVAAINLPDIRSIHYDMSMIFLLLSTAWYIVLGLGSMKAQPWARAFLVIGAWVAIFFGSLALALILYILPEIYTALSNTNLFNPTALLGLLYFSVFALVFLQIIFPIIVLFFYERPSVKNTCKRQNPHFHWIDRYPLPLLAMGFISFIGTLTIFAGSTINYTVFFFGKIIDGWHGMLILAGLSLAWGYVGWGAFSRKIHAWWAAYGFVFLTASSLMLTFSELDLDALYLRMGYSAERIALQQSFPSITPATLTFISCVWGIMGSIYLVWVHDCFKPNSIHTESKSYLQRKAEEEAEKQQNTIPPPPRMRLD